MLLCRSRYSKYSKVPVEKLLRVLLWVVISDPLCEVTISGRLGDKLCQAGCQRLQQHADVRTAVGLELLYCYSV